MQAGSAKGAEGLKSALTSLQRFEESMAPDLTTIIQDVVNVGLWLHAYLALPPLNAYPFTVLLQ